MKKGQDYPDFYEDRSLQTVTKGYLLKGETPKDAYRRLAKSSVDRLGLPEFEEYFFDIMWKGWLGPASPLLSNMGTDRGLPISCYSCSITDSVNGIYKTVHEMAMLTKHGGGVGLYFGKIRPRGRLISNDNGQSEGVVPWIKVYDSAIVATSQGGVRKGAAAAYLDIEHGDVDEFLNIRKTEGDVNRQCLNIHHAVVITDSFMKKVIKGDKESRDKWKKVLKTRYETGEPYLMFVDNANKQKPQSYINNDLNIETSNICNEIYLHTDENHSFVCCLSSLNLEKWNEWKDYKTKEGYTVPYIATIFLDGVMQEFIDKTEGKPGFERSRRFAVKSRALGLGVLGFHSLIQKERLSFDSYGTKVLNKGIFNFLNIESKKASRDLVSKFNKEEPEWCKGLGIRNTHTIALAPTVSNSTICGGVSPSIEPWVANAFNQKSAKGTFQVRNKELENLLKEKGKNTKEVWESIIENRGSVQQLDFLTQEEKDVFKTAYELDQQVLVDLAAQRQPDIDQGQSLNLFFGLPGDDIDKQKYVKMISDIHISAWKQGLKGLYYMRTGSVVVPKFKVINEQKETKEEEECDACEG